MNSTFSQVQVEDGYLFVEQAGMGKDILFIHSGITDRRMWDDQFLALADTFRVTRYDMRGFGESSPVTGRYSHVDDVESIVDWFQWERMSVAAASLGARVAIDLHLRNAGYIDRLLLVGPAISGRAFEDPALRNCWDEMGAAWDNGDIERAIEIESHFWICGPERPVDDTDMHVLERVKAMQRRIVELMPDEDLEIEEVSPASERLGDLDVPILITVGEYDVSDIHQNARAIASAASDVTVVTIPSTGHLPNMESVDVFNDLAIEFLT